MKTIFSVLILLLSVSLTVKSQKLTFAEGSDSTLINKTLKVQKIILRFPESYDATKYYPLLVALHGNGGTAASLAQIFSSHKNNEVILAFPEGQYPKLIKDFIGYSWYYETNDRGLWRYLDMTSVEQVHEVIDVITSKYNIEKTYIFGFSQGASLAYTVGFKYPEKVFGVAAVGGSLPEIDVWGSIVTSNEINKAENVKFLIARGNSDRLCKKSKFISQTEFVESKGFTSTIFEYKGGHYITTELLDNLYDWINKYSDTEQNKE